MSTPIRVALDDYISGELIRNMQKAIDFAKVRVDWRTPEDTWELIAWNRVINPSNDGWVIRASVENTVNHAEIVEFGVWKVYNYHKWPKGSKRKIIRTWVGARMMSLTKDLDEKAIINIIKWNT